MPHEKAPLSKWCEGPTSRCESISFNCEKCNFALKYEALEKKHREENK